MLQKSSMYKVLEVFFKDSESELNLIDLSRKIGLAHTSVKKNLLLLKKAGLIKEQILKRGSRKYPLYLANSNNDDFKKKKRIYNLSVLLESHLIEYLEDTLMPKAIVLFGSYLRGEDTTESDIDLYLECSEESIDLTLYERRIGKKIELHFNSSFNSYSSELKNNIINGFTVSGFLEGYK